MATADPSVGAEDVSEPLPHGALSRVWDAGYNVYRRPEPVRVDCSEMRSLEDHFWQLAEVFSNLELSPEPGEVVRLEAAKRELPRIVQWLRMAAGLRCADVDIAYGEPYLPLCGRAEEYHGASSNYVSAFMTEQTRLLYAWNAVERLLEVLRLPVVPGRPGRFNAATMFLGEYWADLELPAHFDCVARHLQCHAEHDPGLRDNDRLLRAFEETPWRARSGVLLAAANQMRHQPAHGDLPIMQPVTWGPEEPPPSDHVAPLQHAPRLAARGIALSLQMLLLAASPSAQVRGLRTPGPGWWIYEQARGWYRDEQPGWRCLLRHAHLEPPCSEWNRLDDE